MTTQKKTIANNLRKGWITTLIGAIVLIASIVSVFVVDSITWKDAVWGLVIGIGLLFTPDTIIKSLKSILGKFTVILLVSTLMLTSCDPVKRVLKSEDKTLRVVDAYIQKHPFKNDTTITYLPGKTITKTRFLPYRDSTPNRVPCDTFTAKTPQGTIITVDKNGRLKLENDSLKKEIQSLRTDTIQRDVVDRSLLVAAQDLARRQAAQIAAKDSTIKVQAKEIRSERTKNVTTWSLLALITGVFIYRKIRKYIASKVVNTTL